MTKKIVRRTVECDTDKLYGPLDKAILYLKEIHSEHPKAMLGEHWYGYEDMMLRFVYTSEETDEEYQDRVEFEERKKREEEEQAEKERQKKLTLLLRQKEEIERKLKKL